MGRYHIILILLFILFSGCIGGNKALNETVIAPSDSPTPTPIAVKTVQAPAPTPAISPTEIVPKTQEKYVNIDNRSVAVEVNYRDYVDWFRDYNVNIRAYTPQEYICGQYTADMIAASEKAGYKAYFAAVTFSDGTGHALVSFKSTVLGTTSWYFFEPQTNGLITPETLKNELNQNMGKIVTRVDIYGYFDDAGDNDPATWQFAYPLYSKNY
ncbi:MAG: hypothetical protein OIN85_01775 [Candidatus Methanoperedens sp.]|nr:hypothetical protein [Candidatus Methanoperedens sp.]